ncbi:MAG: RNA-dependent DNA polymerase [Gammaproteobacteria bacterium]|nr:RNA-dependent DNA polymerase [Gammaproteobacteria bacterium]
MAKKYEGLYPDVWSFENLYRAFRKASKGKRGKPSVAAFEWHLERNLLILQRELAEFRYTPGGYRSFYVRDPKRRLISAAPFRDRVVHHALCNIIDPVFERTFIADSYANRIGKGTHAALRRSRSFAAHHPYVLQCDVRRFFPAVDHAILQDILERKLDREMLWLCEQILKGGEGLLKDEYPMVFFPGDDLLACVRPRGLPIGNLTSQFWANVYLNELDQFIKRELRCRAYLRYMDDFLLFAADKARLWAWKRALQERLAGLRLTLHEASSTVYPVKNGIPFLGFQVYPDHMHLKRRNGVAFSRRLRRRLAQFSRGECKMSDISNSVRAWTAHARHGETYGLRRSLLSSQCLSLPPR